MTRLTALASLSSVFFVLSSCKTLNTGTSNLASTDPAADACIKAIAPLKGFSYGGDEKRDALKAAFTTCLSEYLKINTVTPPGNEERAAKFFQDIFTAYDIPSRRLDTPNLQKDTSSPTRANIIASLVPDGHKATDPAIGLMHHMDTVDAHADQWFQVQGVNDLPHSGAVFDYEGERYIFGRGAIDMKNIGIMQMLTMILVKFQDMPLKKAVHFLGTADEEGNASGAVGLLNEIRAGGKLEDLLGLEVIYNEGGFGIKDAIGQGTSLHLVGVEERGGAWLRMSSPDPFKLLSALSVLELVPTRSSYVFDLNDKLKELWRGWDCRLSRFETPGAKTNVVPSKAELILSCRNRPTADQIQRQFNFDTVWSAVKKKTGYTKAPLHYKVTSENLTTKTGVKIVVETPSTSHGSAGGTSVLDIAAWGLQRLGVYRELKGYSRPPMLQYQVTPAMKTLLDTIGKTHRFSRIAPNVSDLSGWIEWLPGVLEQSLLGVIGGNLGAEGVFRTSCSWTGFEVIYGQDAKALVDCRLINQRQVQAGQETHFDEFLRVYRDLLGANGISGVKIELESGWNYTASAARGEYYQALQAAIRSQFPGATIAPFLIPGGTDNTFFRDPSAYPASGVKGIPAYGFTPAEVATSVVQSFHGSNERFPLSQMAGSTLVYVDLVQRLAKK